MKTSILKTNILGVNIDVITFNDAIKKIVSFTDENRPHMVFTPNPEMIMLAKNNAAYMHALNTADLVVSDGIGVLLASKLNKIKIKERVTGCDLTQALFDELKSTNKSFYFFGATEGVAKKAAENMQKKYHGLKIAGYRSGIFTPNDSNEIVNEINRANPDILFVGLSMDKQLEWIYNNKDKLKAKVLIGVGGTLDILGGKVKRAPKAFRRLGLEWLYRLIKQPSRLKRQLVLPVFVIYSLLYRIKHKIIIKSNS